MGGGRFGNYLEIYNMEDQLCGLEVGMGREVKEAHVNDNHDIEMDFAVEIERMNLYDASNEEDIQFYILLVCYDILFEILVDI